jgi:phage gp36-like protein
MAYKYANLATFKAFLDVRLLVQLTNDIATVDPTDDSQIDETLLQTLENYAAQTVDNYLRNKYTVPIAAEDLTTDIIGLTAQLTITMLRERRGDTSDALVEMKRDVKARLKGMGEQTSAENLDQAREDLANPARATQGKPRTQYDNAGWWDGLGMAGTYDPAGIKTMEGR